MAKRRPPQEHMRLAAVWHASAVLEGSKIDASMGALARIMGVTKTRVYQWRRWYLQGVSQE